MNKNSYIILLSSVILNLILIILSSFNGLTFVLDSFDYVVKPFSSNLKSISNDTNNFFQKYLDAGKLQNDNFQLRKDIISLREQLSEYNETKKQNDFLKSKSGVVSVPQVTLNLSSVVSLNSGGNVLIDKGAIDNIKEGDIVVVSEKTVLGRVKSVNQFTSVIELISYTKSSSRGVSVMAIDSGKEVRGFLSESDDLNVLNVTDILKSNSLPIGSMFITSGDDRANPRGLVVGTVTSIKEKDTETVKTATIKLDYDLTKLKYVYVLKFKNT
jgi:rod shape-determining protein MreC